MNDFFALLLGVALVNNVVLTCHLGPDLKTITSRHMEVAWLIGLSTVWYLALCLPAVYIAEHFIITTLQLPAFDWLLYISIIILTALFFARIMPPLFPALHRHTAILAPVLLMNSTLLVTALPEDGNTFTSALLRIFFAGAGFLLLLLVLICLRERVDHRDVPEPFRGRPIFLITLGIISMSLMGLPTP